MMKIQKTTTAWVATGALGLSVVSGAAFAFADQSTSSLSTGQGIAAAAVAGEQVNTGMHKAGPNALTAPSTATANTPASPRTANTANTPASPRTPVSAKTPASPKSPVSPRTAPSPKSPASPRTPNSPKSAPSARSND